MLNVEHLDLWLYLLHREKKDLEKGKEGDEVAGGGETA
jgi:hypothetical protein